MKRKVIFISTPLTAMMMALLGVMVYIIMDMKYQAQPNPSKDLNHSLPDPLLHLHSFPRVHSHPHGTGSFRKIGFLTSRELADSTILPLFGEPAPYRRHRWNYYTMTDTHQSLSSVKLPIMYRDRSCVDEVACDEIYTGDIVRVHGYDHPFVVHVY